MPVAFHAAGAGRLPVKHGATRPTLPQDIASAPAAAETAASSIGRADRQVDLVWKRLFLGKSLKGASSVVAEVTSPGYGRDPEDAQAGVGWDRANTVKAQGSVCAEGGEDCRADTVLTADIPAAPGQIRLTSGKLTPFDHACLSGTVRPSSGFGRRGPGIPRTISYKTPTAEGAVGSSSSTSRNLSSCGAQGKART
jgi:hypothetical protein